ncbi:MAG: hypothetical protein DRP78_04700 [Candidatus Omnitrophota bacterium]|nr:MAG: hypothetical protein DRP78_04700 [Candidatus Omnitrophota bacterium]
MKIKDFMSDRRKFVRIHSDFPIEVKQLPLTHQSVHNSLSLNISEGGVRISLFYFYPVNSKVNLTLFTAKDDLPFKALGKVSWVERVPYQERYRLGVEFVDLNDTHRNQLRRIINRISGL